MEEKTYIKITDEDETVDCEFGGKLSVLAEQLLPMAIKTVWVAMISRPDIAALPEEERVSVFLGAVESAVRQGVALAFPEKSEAGEIYSYSVRAINETVMVCGEGEANEFEFAVYSAVMSAVKFWAKEGAGQEEIKEKVLEKYSEIGAEILETITVMYEQPGVTEEAAVEKCN